MFQQERDFPRPQGPGAMTLSQQRTMVYLKQGNNPILSLDFFKPDSFFNRCQNRKLLCCFPLHKK
ncbi:hypothetical protein BREVNS_2479 [Brevinematales bacterium NS]|nr:hypothetical protein BREVNS_2479 [Brevinematales bacterium NS]